MFVGVATFRYQHHMVVTTECHNSHKYCQGTLNKFMLSAALHNVRHEQGWTKLILVMMFYMKYIKSKH